MAVRWVVCGLALLSCAGGLGLGAWLGRREEKTAARVAMLIGLLGLAAQAWLTPARELALFPSGGVYQLLRGWWVLPLALLPLGVGTGALSTPGARRGAGVLGALVLVMAGRPLVLTAAFDPSEVLGRVGPSGVCYQTTDYTCGAAAAAMLLHVYGIEASEADMALACGTNALTGTDVYSVAVGLRERLRGTGRTVRVLPVDWDGLLDRRGPALATIRSTLFVDHWVLIRGVHARGADVLDPIRGGYALTRAELEASWTGWLVSADRPAPTGEAAPVDSAAAPR